MANKRTLGQALQKASEISKKSQAQAHPDSDSASEKTPVPPSRQGKKAITGFFDPAVSRQLKQLALEQDSTVQALLAEALNELFEKYGKKPIA
ncbi:ribbon-helix-helix domain-containing protein (plasmid) [Nostoc sp. UHCC 0302]|uniref:ribbon-helix-helix domain-containing protein n=1 Tax=Nostoc sp. UHCC 0302 TaxID=3134896 RepID=UPI00311CDA59